MATEGVEVQVFADRDALVRAGAEALAEAITAALSERGVCRIALSGGSTPKPVFARMAATGRPNAEAWRRTHVFWVDERCVPPDHADSNYRMACEALFDHVLPASIHRMVGEADPARAAADYEALLRAHFGVAPGEVPVFDLVLLGMGDDGHIASLFPGNEALDERERLVVAPYVDKFSAHRITLTYPVLEAARERLVLVSGAGKHPALQRVLGEETASSADPLPAQRLRPTRGRTRWFLDRAAAEGA